MASDPWYEMPLTIAIVGSIIAVVGQLSGTVIPIMWGPESVSDFAIYVSATKVTLYPYQNQVITSVAVKDLHSFLRPYMHTIHLMADNPPKGINIEFTKGDLRGSSITGMVISHKPNQIIPSGKYLLNIVALGGDGKKRKCAVRLIIPFVRSSEKYNVTIANVQKDDHGLNVAIVNNGTTAMNLTDWKLVTDNKATYIFHNFTLKSKSLITVHSHGGNDIAKDLYGSNFASDGTHEIRLKDDDGKEEGEETFRVGDPG